MRRFFYFYLWFCEREEGWRKLARNNKELAKRRSGNTPSVLTTFTEWRSRNRNVEPKQIDYSKDIFAKCFRNGHDFINTLVKMVAHDIKLSPQEVRQWSLRDLVDMVSDILTRNDTEAFAFYFPES